MINSIINNLIYRGRNATHARSAPMNQRYTVTIHDYPKLQAVAFVCNALHFKLQSVDKRVIMGV